MFWSMDEMGVRGAGVGRGANNKSVVVDRDGSGAGREGGRGAKKNKYIYIFARSVLRTDKTPGVRWYIHMKMIATQPIYKLETRRRRHH